LEYLSKTDNASLSTGDVSFSVAAWVRADTLTSEMWIVSKQDSDPIREYTLRYNTVTFELATVQQSNGAGKSVTASNMTPVAGQWYWVVGWYDAANDSLSISVNNSLPITTTGVSGPADTTSAFRIGGEMNGGGMSHYWNGRIDGVGFWKRTLTAEERTALYNGGNGCDYPFTACPVPTTTTTTYTYASTHKHAVTSLSTSESYTYDPNGNMTSRTETVNGVLTTFAQNFDAENRLTSVLPTPGTVATSFKYNGDGTLVAKLYGTVATYYIGGVYEVEVTNTTTTKQTWYYPAGGALRVIDGTGEHVYYILKDHLGSASVTLDSSGAAVSEMRYYPFGETRVSSGAMPTDQQFTGQRNLGANLGGIYYYGARMYSPKLGRFLSADTIVPNFANPQSLNRFSYTYNNPIRFTDPTGHCTSDPEDPCNAGKYTNPAPPTPTSYCQRYPAECQPNNRDIGLPLPPVPVVQVQPQPYGIPFDPEATWQGLSDVDLLARTILSEEGNKAGNPRLRMDVIGVGWTIWNRTRGIDPGFDYGRNNVFAVVTAGGQYLGMLGTFAKDGTFVPGNAARAANPESYNSWFGTEPDAGRKAYWAAVAVAKGIIDGSVPDPTNGALYYADARYKKDGSTELYPDGRTRFRNTSGGHGYSIPELVVKYNSP
jgi:RHS repeat-associated protein